LHELTNSYFDTLIDAMRDRGVEFASGLNIHEIETAEKTHNFRFPPDLRSFLMRALPIGKSFPDWRDPSSKLILGMLSWPADSMCFDIEHDQFWLPDWGARPNSLEFAFEKARNAVSEAPFLIPVYGHRYMPADPCSTGNPIFSVYQTDIIYYGFDLCSYLSNEFGVPNPFPTPDEPREIKFWSELERLNG